MKINFTLKITSEKKQEHTLSKEESNIYKEEHQRLESIISDSEDIWEDRTYQISAGGLTLTFTVFSYLSTRDAVLNWNVCVIWGIYVFCMLLNYISHRVTICKARKLQEYLYELRKFGAPYDENLIIEKYKNQDKCINRINYLVQTILVIDIIYSLIYTYLLIL